MDAKQAYLLEIEAKINNHLADAKQLMEVKRVLLGLGKQDANPSTVKKPIPIQQPARSTSRFVRGYLANFVRPIIMAQTQTFTHPDIVAKVEAVHGALVQSEKDQIYYAIHKASQENPHIASLWSKPGRPRCLEQGLQRRRGWSNGADHAHV